MEKMKLFVISHTHWDREWYQDFQNYRYRLVRLVDDLLDMLERNPAYKVFHLDGQTIVLRDYLDIRPENAERLKKQIQDGRIVIGPWYVMPDEFLSSGETLVKNLQKGFEICADYGVEPMRNGYVTDIFGHNSQFPQILRGFGIEAATLYRGIGDYEKDTFLWQAPDGSRVVAYKLDRERSYSNFYFAVRYPYEDRPFDPQDAVERMKQLRDRMKAMAVTDMSIMMDGVDHVDADENVLELIKLFEREIPDIEFVHARLDEYLTALKARNIQLDVIEGALYNLGYEGINNQVLKNVLSSAVHLKQENDRCETLLTRIAQPLDAFTTLLSPRLAPLGKDDYTAKPRKGYFDKAWDYLLQNEPHDSICGCSKSDVHRDNAYRFRQCRLIAERMTEDAMDELAANTLAAGDDYTGQILVYNPSPRACGPVFLTHLDIPAGHQGNLRFFGPDGAPIRVQLIRNTNYQQCIHSLRHLIRFRIMERWEAAVELPVPPLGYAVIGYRSLTTRWSENGSYSCVELHHPQRLTGSLRTAKDVFDNGVVELKVQADGRLQVTEKATGRVFRDLLTFEDCADVGDGWNYRKPLTDSRIFDTGAACRYSVESDGPLATVLRIDKTLEIPESFDSAGNRRSEATVPMTVSTTVFLLKGERVISFRTTLKNQAVHHRLRVLFPTGMKTDTFVTKLPFDMASWNIRADDYAAHVEEETFVHPSQGVTYIGEGAGGAALFTRGLYEVEVTDDQEHSLTATLFRSPVNETGMVHPEDGLMQRELTFDYAFCPACGGAEDALLEGEKWRAGCACRYFEQGRGQLPRAAALLSLSGESVVVSNLVLAAGGAYDVRLYDISGRESRVELGCAQPILSAELVDLKGGVLSPLEVRDGKVLLPVSPHKILTVRFHCS